MLALKPPVPPVAENFLLDWKLCVNDFFDELYVFASYDNNFIIWVAMSDLNALSSAHVGASPGISGIRSSSGRSFCGLVSLIRFLLISSYSLRSAICCWSSMVDMSRLDSISGTNGGGILRSFILFQLISLKNLCYFIWPISNRLTGSSVRSSFTRSLAFPCRFLGKFSFPTRHLSIIALGLEASCLF